MLTLRRSLILLGLALSLAPQVLAQAAQTPTKANLDPDDPRARAAWNETWFGKITPEYLAFKNQAAAREVNKWGFTFPQQPGSHLLQSASLTGPTWTNLGPTKSSSTPLPDIDSGRPVSIVTDPTDPKVVYLATSGGGVWKSINADTASLTAWTWTPVTDSLPNSSATGNVSCGALAMSPANHLVLYLALGDAFDAAGTGIYKTTDGGTTWTAATVTGATPTRTYQILAVDANVVLVGTNAGLLRSTDGGSTFSKVSQPAGSIWTVQGFGASNLICSSQGTDQGIWYSSNAGSTWTAASVTYQASTTPGRITLATSPVSTTQAWGEYEDTATGNIARGLLKTTDSGQTWTFVTAPTASGGLFQGTGPQMSGDGGQAFYNHCLAVDPTNINRVFMGANLALYRTTDGGSTWSQLSHWYGSGHAYVHADFHANTWSSDGTKLYIGNDGGLAVFRDPFRSSIPTADDSTFVYNGWNEGLATHLCYNLGSTQATNATDANYRISLGLQDNGTRIRQGSGSALATSSTFNDEIGGDGFGTVWHPTDATKVLGSYYYAQILRSTDGGGTFSAATSGITEAGSSSNAPFQTRLSIGNIATPDVVYTPVNTKVYKSADFGATWSAMTVTGLPTSSFGIRNIGASITSNAVGIAGNSGRVFLYYPANAAWTGSTSDVTGGAFYTSSVWFDTTNDQTVYLTSVAASSTAHHLWKSANGGSTWTSIDGSAGLSNGLPFGIPIHTIKNLTGNSNILFAGTDFGVYKSTDGGSSWVRFGTGLPMVATRDLYLAPDGTYIRAATFGRGVWEASLVSAAPSVTVTATTSTSVNVSGTVTFKATSNLSPNTVTWTATGGTFSPLSTAGDGVATTTYTAPSVITGVSQSFTVTATGSDATTTGTATVTVFDPAQVILSVSPSTAQTVLTGKTVSFTPTTNYGNVTWTTAVVTNANAGTISPTTTATTVSAVFTAPATTGDITVKAQSAGTASQSITVHVKNLDVNGDSVVDVRDLLKLMGAYGTATSAADLNGDSTVNDADLTLFLANF